MRGIKKCHSCTLKYVRFLFNTWNWFSSSTIRIVRSLEDRFVNVRESESEKSDVRKVRGRKFRVHFCPPSDNF